MSRLTHYSLKAPATIRASIIRSFHQRYSVAENAGEKHEDESAVSGGPLVYLVCISACAGMIRGLNESWRRVGGFGRMVVEGGGKV